MKLLFTKMHGLGNDFIIVDCREKDIPSPGKVFKKLSDRRFGIGFDQAIILKKPSKGVSADFRMDIYNSDGGRVEMCGNGIRCLANYVWKRKLSKKRRLDIDTLAGIIRPEKDGRLVRVDMGEPVLEGRDIPVAMDGLIKDYPFIAGDRTFRMTCVSMGNPHAVIFVRDADSFPVEKYGPLIENSLKFFPKRTNVEFIEVLSPRRVKMRVWERGSGQTLACGTGACAAAVASNLNGFTGTNISVTLKGGALKIEWSKQGRVYMTGPAMEVYEGSVDI